METIERIELASGVEPPAGSKDGSIILASGAIHDGRFLSLNLGVVDTDNGELDRDDVALIIVKATEAVAETPVVARRPSVDPPTVAAVPLPGQCGPTRERAEQLRAELEASLSSQARTSAERYVAEPGPGVDAVKAWGDYAAAALLEGDVPVAVWASLKAVAIDWNGEAVANAGVYLIHFGKAAEALHMLTCAHAMGYRSPYLFEALAVIHQTRGNSAEARRAISQAQEMEPDDVIIATEASLILTGQPPPPSPPRRDPDGLDEAVRQLAEHGERALNLMKIQSDRVDRSLPGTGGSRYYQLAATYVNAVVAGAREHVLRARAATDPPVRQGLLNSAFQYCVTSYASISDTLLSFPDSLHGSPLLFWAEVLGLDAPVLGRESNRSAVAWSMHGGDTALAQGASARYRRDKEAAHAEYANRRSACRDKSCTVREDARWCGVWQELYDTWANASRQRHDTAARAFDRIATRRLMQAENEWLRVRDYAIRQIKKMRFRKVAGIDMGAMTVQTIDLALEPVYQRHVISSDDAAGGTVNYLRERAAWFVQERLGMEETLAREAEEMQHMCAPAMQALLELLAQQEWLAYLDHLRERRAWGIQATTEDGDCPPGKFKIGPLNVTSDLSNLGEGKFDVTWEKGGFSAEGTATVGGDSGVAFSGQAEGKIRGVTIGVNSAGESSMSGSAGYGPFRGKGEVTLTSKVNPYNNREYMGIKLKGSAGFGLGRDRLGFDCYPSSGSVTIYPRAILESAASSMSTK